MRLVAAHGLCQELPSCWGFYLRHPSFWGHHGPRVFFLDACLTRRHLMKVSTEVERDLVQFRRAILHLLEHTSSFKLSNIVFDVKSTDACSVSSLTFDLHFSSQFSAVCNSSFRLCWTAVCWAITARIQKYFTFKGKENNSWGEKEIEE